MKKSFDREGELNRIKRSDLLQKNSDGVMLVYLMDNVQDCSQNSTEESKKESEQDLKKEIKGQPHPSFFNDKSGQQAKETLKAVLAPRQ